MEARLFRPLMGVATVAFCLFPSLAMAQRMWAPQPMIVHAPMASPAVMPPAGPMSARSQSVVRTENFIVFASSQAWANQVAQVAEQHRRELAIYWLGRELPTWPEACPIHVTSSPNLGAGGETRFSLLPHGAGNWEMSVQGTQERILDSVLPHEITHTIFATYFARLNKYVPRWADEGACTTVEHEAEKSKHRHYLTGFLKTGRGLAFNEMFRLKEYPEDILPLYAQGHSAVQFLIDQSSAREFIQFLEQGMQTDDWSTALRNHYAYASIGEFQTQWNKWLLDGSPKELLSYAPRLQQEKPATLALVGSGPSLPSAESTANLDGKTRFAIGNTQPAPVHLAGNSSITPSDPAGSYYIQRLRALHTGTGAEAGGVQSNALPSTTATHHAWQDISTPASIALADRQVSPAAALPGTTSASTHASARRLEPQSPGMQVLDMGNSLPVHGNLGSASASSGMVPILR